MSLQPAMTNLLNSTSTDQVRSSEARDDLIRRVSLLKRNAMAAPFERAFDEFYKLQEAASKFTSESAPEGVREGGEVMAIHYREEEAIYIKASHDRVTVIFSTIFREETDRIFGKVFLQVRVLSPHGVITTGHRSDHLLGIRRCEAESHPECTPSSLQKRPASGASERKGLEQFWLGRSWLRYFWHVTASCG